MEAVCSAIENESLLNEYGVARLTGMSVASVRKWRLFGRGPRYLKIGSAVRYKPADVSAWIESQPSSGGHQEARSNAAV